MEQHLYFNLWLHSDEELNPLLPAPLAARTTLHEWPLSCVQLLRLVDGSRLIYKVQTDESIEPDFYSRASSALLPANQILGTHRNTTAMLLEFIAGSRLDERPLNPAEAVHLATHLEGEIAMIKGDLPAYQDLGTPDHWRDLSTHFCSALVALIDSGQFNLTSRENANRLFDWAASESILATCSGKPVFAHADLHGENIMVTPQGYKILDWQYPRWAPAGFDQIPLLQESGCDPRQYVDPTVVEIFWFVRLGWFVECKTRLFPQGSSYDQSVSELAEAVLLSAASRT